MPMGYAPLLRPSTPCAMQQTKVTGVMRDEHPCAGCRMKELLIVAGTIHRLGVRVRGGMPQLLKHPCQCECNVFVEIEGQRHEATFCARRASIAAWCRR